MPLFAILSPASASASVPRLPPSTSSPKQASLPSSAPPPPPPPSLDFLPKAGALRYLALYSARLRHHPSILRLQASNSAAVLHCYIPNPKTRYRTEGIAMVASRTGHLKYKIIRFSQPKRQNYDLRCEIFDSRTKAWRQSNDIQLPPCTLLSLDPAVSVNGVVHWRTIRVASFRSTFATRAES